MEKELFYKVRPKDESWLGHMGSWLVIEPCELEDFPEHSEHEEYQRIPILRTRAWFEKLKEFDGF